MTSLDILYYALSIGFLILVIIIFYALFQIARAFKILSFFINALTWDRYNLKEKKDGFSLINTILTIIGLIFFRRKG